MPTRLPIPRIRSTKRKLSLEPSADKYLWGNPAYHPRPAHHQRVRDVSAGPRRSAASRAAARSRTCRCTASSRSTATRRSIIPTEVAITDRREKELSDQGFISLVYCKDTDYAAFFGSQTVNKPKKYNLALGQFECRAFGAAALYSEHVALRALHQGHDAQPHRQLHDEGKRPGLSDDLDQRLRARQGRCRPGPQGANIRCARRGSTWSDVPGQPGAYSATVFLRPHFQLEGLTASLRLVAELPPPAAA